MCNTRNIKIIHVLMKLHTPAEKQLYMSFLMHKRFIKLIVPHETVNSWASASKL